MHPSIGNTPIRSTAMLPVRLASGVKTALARAVAECHAQMLLLLLMHD